MNDEIDLDGAINSIGSDFKKAKVESFKAKAKEIMKKRDEAVKTVKLADMELEKLIADTKALHPRLQQTSPQPPTGW